jgi:outer membrane protein assembly factor BamD (BamD/ComL family)
MAAEESLAAARAAIDRDDQATAEILLLVTITGYGETESGWRAREELAAILYEPVEDAIKEGNIQVATQALEKIVEIDPEAIVTADLQQNLVEELLNHSPHDSAPENEPTAISALAEIVERFPTSKTTQQIVGPVANGLFDEALEFAENGDPARSLQKLEQVIQKYPLTLAAEKCRVMQSQLVDDLLARAEALRQTKDDATCAKYLRELVAKFEGTELELIATQTLENLAVDMLAKARDANYERDWAAKAETQRQLEEGFGSDRILAKMRRECSRKELKARDLLRRGNQLERVAGIDAAIRQYNELVNHHSGTLAAKKAQNRLRDLGRGATDEDASHMLETMFDSDESAVLLLETMQ